MLSLREQGMVLVARSRERKAKGECIVCKCCTYLIHRLHFHSFQLNTQELFIRKQKHEVVYNPKYPYNKCEHPLYAKVSPSQKKTKNLYPRNCQASPFPHRLHHHYFPLSVLPTPLRVSHCLPLPRALPSR